MTLGNMRQLGVQNLIASCLNDACRHVALIDVSRYPADTEVPWFSTRVVCAKCGGRGGKIDVRPNWKEQPAGASLTGKVAALGSERRGRWWRARSSRSTCGAKAFQSYLDIRRWGIPSSSDPSASLDSQSGTVPYAKWRFASAEERPRELNSYVTGQQIVVDGGYTISQ
jgi:NAD(P)-dependent dehydrogenase (short-subunit alcohol dehydrogenase family)